MIPRLPTRSAPLCLSMSLGIFTYTTDMRQYIRYIYSFLDASQLSIGVTIIGVMIIGVMVISIICASTLAAFIGIAWIYI